MQYVGNKTKSKLGTPVAGHCATSRAARVYWRGAPNDVWLPARVTRTVHELANKLSVPQRPDESSSFVPKSLLWWQHATTRGLRTQSWDTDSPAACCCIERCPILADLFIQQALDAALPGNGGVMASCSDREDKPLKSPFWPELGEEGKSFLSDRG